MQSSPNHALFRFIFLLLVALFAPAIQADMLEGRHGTIHYEWSARQPTCPNLAPVVLVHGFSTPMWAWTPLFEALQNRGCPVLRFDLHGRGQSQSAAIDTLSTFHDQINDLRTHLAIEGPMNMVGWSMGGAITASYTKRYPDRIENLVLVAPFSQAKDIPLIGLPVWDWVVVNGIAQFEPPWGYRHNFADPDLFEMAMPHYAQMFQDIVLNPDMARSLLSSAREIITQDQLHHYQTLGMLNKPVLMLWGREDEVLAFEEHEPLLKAMPQAQFQVIPQCGHVPQLERPDVFLPAVFDFLLP
ncbi:MAG: alpha/beta hydrolase [Limnobacter sp.]|nr:alpha/beta hydrolase [Limnobacter sp.]